MSISETSTPKAPSGMFGLTIVMVGQAVSILASGMTGFALSIWVFQKTSSATALGGMTSAFTIPYLLLIPLAGVLVDRYNRKLMMMVSDLAAGLGTLTILILFATGKLQVWHFYIINVVIAMGNTFQWPAYSAAITTMVPKEQYGRANGLMSLVQTGPGMVSPLLAGALLPVIGLQGILLIDLASMLVAIGALLLVHIPNPQRTVDGQQGAGNIFKEAAFGFRYIFQRRSLLGFVLIVFSANLFMGFPNSVTVPMILSRTGNDSLVLGSVQTAGSIAIVIGSLVISAWGGFKRRMFGFVLGWLTFYVFGYIVFGLGRGLNVWIPASMLGTIMIPLGNSSSQSILQAKVAPDVQGRVFSARRLLTWAPDMFTPIIGGAVADYIMEPAMQSGGWLSSTFGWMVGNGPGSGMSLMMIFFGLISIFTLFLGCSIPAVRNMEDILPDHDQLLKAEPEPV
jgi:DHA3 family macrolide efflux protein-like MFS transporter